MKCEGKKALDEGADKGAIEACVEWLMDNEFISIQKDGQGTASRASRTSSVSAPHILI